MIESTLRKWISIVPIIIKIRQGTTVFGITEIQTNPLQVSIYIKKQTNPKIITQLIKISNKPESCEIVGLNILWMKEKKERGRWLGLRSRRRRGFGFKLDGVLLMEFYQC